MYKLYIANKNYSSWSLRPWVLMRMLDIPFVEEFRAFARTPEENDFDFSPSRRVPCLYDDGTVVWDSLAIVEYLAERHPGVWPVDAVARAWARSASAEMHSGFSALRNTCSMSCGVRIRLASVPDGLTADIARICALWEEGLQRFGGPWLAGKDFTAVDAFFAPVAFRAQTYGLDFGADGNDYVERLLALPPMREWYAAGLAETFREVGHDEEVMASGTLLQDLRATA